jgi:DNA-binding transcriptional LysR family regulator
MDTLKAMDLFVRIVERGSLTAAADGSGLSPTMVGNYLQALEDHLGARLLNRTTRRQSLTEAGKLYYERCVEALELIKDAEALASEAQRVPKGRLRIACSAAFGAEVLLPSLANYFELYPAVEVEAILTDAGIDLVEEGFEAAIRTGGLPGNNLEIRPLKPYRLAVCASPAYVERHSAPTRPAQLREHRCLTYIYSSRLPGQSMQSVWRLEGPEGEINVPVLGPLQADSAPGLRRAALAGHGVVMLPEIMLADDIASGRLIRLLPEFLPPLRPVNLFYVRDRRMSRKLRSFVEFVTSRFG